MKIIKNNQKLIQGDCLVELKKIEDNTIDLIVVDPPYNIGKAEWDKIDNYIEWLGEIFQELERALKRSGSFYFFHNNFPTMAEIQCYIDANTKFHFQQMITIDKEEGSFVKKLYGSQGILRNFIGVSEYILYYTKQEGTGYTDLKHEYDSYYHIKKYMMECRNKLKEEGIDLRKYVKWTTYFHYFSQGKSWNMIPEKRYQKLQKIFPSVFHLPYVNLDKWYKEEQHRINSEKYTFNASYGIPNVWVYNFSKDMKHGHPTQKPIQLLEDIVRYSSNEGDVVLDCFMGSGTTGVACKNLNRKFIGIELNEEYFKIAKTRIESV